MRGYWKPGRGFPPPLFLLETGVSSLCPVPCSEIFYQEERQLGQELAALRATGIGQRAEELRAGARPDPHPPPRPWPAPEPWDPSQALVLSVPLAY